MLHRFRSDVIDLKPSILVILAGINDIAENSGPYDMTFAASNIMSMIEIAKENRINVILCSMLPANRYYWRNQIQPANQVVELNKKLKSIAQTKKLSYVDFYTPMVDEQLGLKKEYGEDGVHPSHVGYDLMKKLLEPVIRNTVMRPRLAKRNSHYKASMKIQPNRIYK